MDILRAIEIFAFVTGIVYIILEIGQKKSMWIVGILTGVACAYSFFVQKVYASMGLNIYYTIMSVWGIIQWGRDSGEVEEGSLHLRRMPLKTALLSLALWCLGTAALVFLLKALGGNMTLLDASVTVASAIATWWLVKSYPAQWLVWIGADLLSGFLCLRSGLHWMAVLYLAYALSAVYGYVHWMKNGKYID